MADLPELVQRRAAYVALELKILEGGQEYEISSGPDGSRMKRANLADVRASIAALDREIEVELSRQSGTRPRVRVAMPTW